MHRLFAPLLAFALLGTASSDLHAEPTWDVTIEAAGGAFSTEAGAKFLGFARVRPGLLWPNGTKFWALGPYFETGTRSWGTVGAQGQYLNLKSALWGQLMLFHDLDVGRPGIGVAAGWSVFGLELQRRSFEPEGGGFAALVKVHLPLGVAGYAMREGTAK